MLKKKKPSAQLQREINEALSRSTSEDLSTPFSRELDKWLSAHPPASDLYNQGFRDGLKGRANRYADDLYLNRVAWQLASKTARAKQLKGGYTEDDPGLSLDPYGNAKMIELQLAAPGTPEEYRLAYQGGTKQRRRGRGR